MARIYCIEWGHYSDWFDFNTEFRFRETIAHNQIRSSVNFIIINFLFLSSFGDFEIFIRTSTLWGHKSSCCPLNTLRYCSLQTLRYNIPMATLEYRFTKSIDSNHLFRESLLCEKIVGRLWTTTSEIRSIWNAWNYPCLCTWIVMGDFKKCRLDPCMHYNNGYIVMCNVIWMQMCTYPWWCCIAFTLTFTFTFTFSLQFEHTGALSSMSKLSVLHVEMLAFPSSFTQTHIKRIRISTVLCVCQSEISSS